MATRHCETKPLDEAEREGTKYELTRQFIQISAVFLLCVRTLAASPITLTPGSLLVQQTGFPPMGTIHQYTPSGSLLGTLVVTGTTDIPESLPGLNLGSRLHPRKFHVLALPANIDGGGMRAPRMTGAVFHATGAGHNWLRMGAVGDA
jgi:hypothetical protein